MTPTDAPFAYLRYWIENAVRQCIIETFFFAVREKVANKASGSQFSDQDVNKLISYCQSEIDLWLISSPS